MTLKSSLKYVTLLALPLAAMTTFSSTAAAFEPEGKVECIAPSDPGGGWDFTCRSVGNVLQELDLVSGNVQTINMAGAGGGVAYGHTISKRAGDEELLVAASTATTTRLAQGQFPDMTADMVNWIGALGADYGIIAVSADSEYDDLNELMDALKEDPRSVKFAGGSAKGGWDHLKVLIAAQAAEVENLPRIAYLSYNNGGEALTQVIGGHVEAFTGDITEAQGFMESGDLKVLAVLSEERLPGDLSDIPTAREQGIDALGPNWRGFYMPADISDEAKQYWVDAMDTIYASDEWKNVMQQNGLMPFHMSAGEFETFVKDQIKDIEQLSTDIGLIQ
ncbi:MULTISPECIES: Bug family tripartite tricarboxylate transporter substrate binding protein [Halomonadaceae]|jgi:putative tricarboxylic transport membrane protein|uniref:Bug family tripartite tricarboxylate transporter substrate binding protein n=1 Tax=Halomonadaceae TaxID=28256 RepID=UPI0015944F4A|nr:MULTISPECIES: tripartite tricarboxylate transporter substrate-binding protein [Halomonas]MCW4150688.1 tripartite tricarboxylate transporter substrate-binding protein [Halomonas sp. 18H]MDR5885927.1 tripartite tricarboxylate transporter substrate-binding protein [Halomonas janggokensis]QPL45960.1 tripartite tricarboxylate transporter substrate binding protein [Halomonas sp. A40-4]